MRQFYGVFQKSKNILEQAIKAFNEIVIRKEFYFYYNSQYWFIELKEPYVKITYDKVPLPGA